MPVDDDLCGAGAQCVAVTESGAPSGEKRVVMWQPPMEADAEGGETMSSPYKESGEVVASLMAAGLQTLAFVPARKASAELLGPAQS